MRPEKLAPLFSSISVLKGVGPKMEQQLSDYLGGNKVNDILLHIPSSYQDRRSMPEPRNMEINQWVSAKITVQKHQKPPRLKGRRLPYRVITDCQGVRLDLVFFQYHPEHIARQLPEGEVRVISGKVDMYDGTLQINHPDMIVTEDKLSSIAAIVPHYRAANVISAKLFRSIREQALARIPLLEEWQDAAWLAKQQWPSWREAMIGIHTPEEVNDFDFNKKNYMRLVYDELLAHQVALKLVRYHSATKEQLLTKVIQGHKFEQLKTLLPFTLTKGQLDVINQIKKDQESAKRMLRLLQGDVGSGKTVVALGAMLNAIEAGKQAAIMAPTEILASQHYEFMSSFAQELNINVGYLSGRMSQKDKRQLLEQLDQGAINLVIGTHALFQNKVSFANLGMVVIDEQHRFGVDQRMSLYQKGNDVDVLLMTATPIPRTLTLAYYGDMDVSLLTEKPKGRKLVDTRLLSTQKIDQVMQRLKQAVQNGKKAYWICPLVEESEKLNLTAVNDRFRELKHIVGDDKVAVVHGQMDAKEREQAMEDFRQGRVQLLVATTVIEVGVDVKDATIMVIEHAERFGLSQLHQLRGRVGRGSEQSSCLLLYDKLSQTGQTRLQVMRDSNDGFYLAEEDLKLRGAGDVLGTKQSGVTPFIIASLFEQSHRELLRIASSDAELIVGNDPFLKSNRGKAIQQLLYLFRCDEQVKYFYSG